jgi:hypothetical protein
MSTKTNPLWKKLDQLRTELVELAFTLDSRGRFDASDVAMTTSARVGELCEELIQRPASSFAKASAVAGAMADKTEDRSNAQRRTSKA